MCSPSRTKGGKKMKICVPTQEDKGIDSVAYGHFGSAPYYIIHDTDKGETRSMVNMNQHHAHGSCNPMAALGKESIEVVIVGGIGKRAIEGLNAMGIKVYRSMAGTVHENIHALQNGSMLEFTPQDACGGHGHGMSCGS
ncbi:MAG: NifB/NifX family molybdenum-iron cluster-binding protein [Nitrospirota bacterium]